MKVLWFTNTPSMSASQYKQKVIGGGWIASLENALESYPEIQLGISYVVINNTKKPFSINNTVYYPVNKSKTPNRISRILEGWDHKSPLRSDMKPYMDVINDFQPDVIHVFGSESEFGLIAGMTDIPCIVYIQGVLTVITQKWFNGLTPLDVVKYSPKLPLIKGRGLFHDYYKMIRSARREQTILRKGKFFIGRTDWDRRIITVLSPGSKYFHCDEIMRPLFYQKEWSHRSHVTQIRIISTTRNTIYKGLETILECASYLRSLFPDKEILWEVAGVKSSDEVPLLLEKKLKRKFKESGIILLGPLNEVELVSEMLEADLFVHPSHTDNSPNSVCEAMLLGMPVISTFAGGIPAIVTDKEDGLLVQDGDPIALAGAIYELNNNPEFAISLSQRARAKAMMRHDPARVTQTLVGIYSEVLNN